MTETEAPRNHRLTRKRTLFWFVLGVAAVVVATDQLTKWWAETTLGDGQVINVIGDVLRFWLVYNPGAAFGLGAEFTWILAILAAAAVGIAWYSWRVGSRWWVLVLGLLLGGAITHLGDRLFREPGFGVGHVVDFIDYGGLFVGNVADIALVGGAIAAVILTMAGVAVTGKPRQEGSEARQTATDETEVG